LAKPRWASTERQLAAVAFLIVDRGSSIYAAVRLVAAREQGEAVRNRTIDRLEKAYGGRLAKELETIARHRIKAAEQAYRHLFGERPRGDWIPDAMISLPASMAALELLDHAKRLQRIAVDALAKRGTDLSELEAAVRKAIASHRR
jgi:hypothetical protein